MKNFILSKTKSLILCFALISSITFAQTTHIVDNNTGTTPDFTDLQAAIDAATTGDIIYVQQSPTTYGTISIIDKGLTLIGRSHSDAGYKSIVGSISLSENSSNTTFRGLDISSINEGTQVAAGTIENIVIADCKVSSINFQQNNIKNNILIQGNVITSSLNLNGSDMGTTLITNNVFNSSTMNFSSPANTLFTNNIVRTTGGVISGNTTEILNISNSIFIANIDFIGSTNYEIPMNGNYQISNCLTYYYNGTSLTFATNSASVNVVQNTLLNTDPLFTSVNGTSSAPTSIAYGVFNAFEDDLTFQTGSPAIGAGSGNVDLGVFEGYNFKNFGTPNGYPSIKIDSYSATVPKNTNLTVTIKAKTN